MSVKVLNFKNYDVCLVDDLVCDEVKNKISQIEFSKAFIISDSNVLNLYKDDVLKLFPDAKVIKLNPGEKEKNLENYKMIIEELLSNGIMKDDLIISFGGGVVSDLVGFVAASIKRGVRHLIISTTIVSQIDASIGGKVAVDVSNYKNQVGTFYDPILVISPLKYLKTLPEKEAQNGFGELFKMALIGSNSLYEEIRKADFKISEKVIKEAILIKKEIVQRDYFDCGERHILNFGHTFGHAIEALENFKISHGIAVLNGIKIALELGCKMQLSICRLKDDAINIIKAHNIKLSNYNLKDLKKYLLQDKKSSQKFLRLVLVEDIGKPAIVDVDWNELDELID